MGPLDVGISQFAIVSGHVKAGMAKQALQAEDIPSISQEADRGGMPQGVGTAADPPDTSLLAVADNPFPDVLTGHWQTINGQKQGDAPRV